MAKAGSSFESYALALLRIVAGFTFTLHGAQKFGALGGLRGHAATAFTMLWFGGVLEIIGGPLIILGLFTRPVAFILCGEMAVAYFTVHVHMGPWLYPLLNNGEITVLYCFLWLYLATVGAGALSLDGAFRKR
ncbi:MAG TPA: DoxX family protein [Bryobacteraceae bacterium]|nr:DoxX family protein [Bryobacteraceae bacterium]